MQPPRRAEALAKLRAAVESYAPLRDQTWEALAAMSTRIVLPAGSYFAREGSTPQTFGYVCQGLLRHFATNEDGQQYNKVFFPEGTFPGSMAALLTNTPSSFSIEALEESTVLAIHFARYRELLAQSPDLMWFQIRYLETNWLLAKEPREVALVQESATERYLRFRREHPDLDRRLPQYHVASHLGITPTQLSRIRRALRDRGDR